MTGENFKYKTEKVDKEIYSLIKKRWDAVAKPIDGLGKEQFKRVLIQDLLRQE